MVTADKGQDPVPLQTGEAAHAFVPFDAQAVARSMPDRFHQQVARYPERIAVASESRVVTYGELNQLADRLAAVLLREAVKASEPLALMLGHDLSMIVAIIAALKVGKAYVPLDPEYPPARLQFMLDDCGASLLVSSTRFLDKARNLVSTRTRLLLEDEIPQDTPAHTPGVRDRPRTSRVCDLHLGLDGTA